MKYILAFVILVFVGCKDKIQAVRTTLIEYPVVVCNSFGQYAVRSGGSYMVKEEWDVVAYSRERGYYIAADTVFSEHGREIQFKSFSAADSAIRRYVSKAERKRISDLTYQIYVHTHDSIENLHHQYKVCK